MTEQSTLKQEPYDSLLFPLRMTVQKGKHELVTPHWHKDQVELIQVLRGRVTARIESSEFQAAEGDFFLIRPYATHAVVDNCDGDAAIRGLVFDRDLPHRFMDETIRPLFALYLSQMESDCFFPANHPIVPRLSEVIDLIHQEYTQQDIGFRENSICFLSTMMTALIRSYKILLNQEVERRDKQAYRRLGPVLDYIEANYHRKIYSDELAQIANISLFHFSRLFKKTVGIPIHSYINSYRIRKAKDLLLKTELSVTDIAEMTGFCNVNYFDTLFKRATGFTPREIRNFAGD